MLRPTIQRWLALAQQNPQLMMKWNIFIIHISLNQWAKNNLNKFLKKYWEVLELQVRAIPKQHLFSMMKISLLSHSYHLLLNQSLMLNIRILLLNPNSLVDLELLPSNNCLFLDLYNLLFNRIIVLREHWIVIEAMHQPLLLWFNYKEKKCSKRKVKKERIVFIHINLLLLINQLPHKNRFNLKNQPFLKLNLIGLKSPKQFLRNLLLNHKNLMQLPKNPWLLRL